MGAGLYDSITEVDAALADFAKIAPRQGTMVEMRFWGRFGVEEIAGIMGRLDA
jgi:hypothetical protein